MQAMSTHRLWAINLAEGLVHLTDVGLGSQRVAKLCLDHGERGVDVLFALARRQVSPSEPAVTIEI
jgi:hypothetical protein